MSTLRGAFHEGFFSIPRKIITAEEALKDVIPVDWDYALKDWVDDESQAIRLVKGEKND